MESTSEVVRTEHTKSSVSKKCVQEVSATSVQKLSSSALTGQKSVLSILEADGGLIGNQIASDSLEMAEIPTTLSSLSLSSPIITSPSLPEEDNAVNTSSLQSEFSAMKLKDEHGNEIGEIVQEKQQQQSVKASSSVTSSDGGSKSTSSVSKVSSSTTSSSLIQQSATSLLAEAQESSSSSNTVADKSVCVEELPENTRAKKQLVKEEVKVTIKKCVEDGNKKIVETVEDKKSVEQIVQSSKAQKETEEVEEEDEDDDEEAEEVEENTNQKVTEVVVDTPDGGQGQILTVKTVNKVTTEIEEKPEEIKTKPFEASKGKKEEIKEQEEVKEEKEGYEEESEEEEEEVQKVEQEVTEKVDELEKAPKPCQQQLNINQIPEEPEYTQQPPVSAKEETVVDAPSTVLQTNPQDNNNSNKQDSLNNTIKDIISSIDSNIKAEENIAALKERELELLKKQHELAKEIEQQKLLAQKLVNENQMQQQKLNNNLINQESSIPSKTYQPTTNISKYSNYDEKLENNIYSRKFETSETRESTNVTKKIDLNKIFTPATDSEEILPKNRKLYASSAFYSPTLHPTVEDQVELARRISHSLSDISNQQSRGQSMYVNRKKRSVKWVHEGCGQVLQNKDVAENTKIASQEENDQAEKENDINHHEKVPLKFLMNPSGQMRDINSLRESINTQTGLLSPDVSAEVVTALQAQKGKDYHQYQQQPKPSTSPSILPAYTDAAKHRVQLNLHQEQLLEKYAKPGLKVVQTPWEAALNSGSASAAFVEEQKLSPYRGATLTPSPAPQIHDASQGGMLLHSAPTVPDSYSKAYYTDDLQKYPTQAAPQQQAQHERQYTGTNPQRELAYKPSIPQGWKAPSMSLPKVEFKEQNQNKTNLSANEINHIQEQNIASINEVEKLWEEFHTTDETELIHLLPKDDITAGVHNINMTIPQVSAHEYTNHLIKSPELRLYPIPISTQIIYDNAVRELQVKQLKIVDKPETKRSINSFDSHIEEVKEKEEKVNVRKQLKEYEDLQRQFAMQIEVEQLLQKKREVAKLKALQHNKKKTAGSNSNDTNINSNASDSSLKSSAQQLSVQQDDEEYVKVPVKELITNFEQQHLQDEKVNAHSALASSSYSTATLKKNIIMEAEHQRDVDDLTKYMNEDLYMPKEIPLQSYAPPPVTVSHFPSNEAYDTNQFSPYKPLGAADASPMPSYYMPESKPATTKTFGGSSSFPVSKPYQQGFSSTYGNSQPPKQQYLPPESYQKVPQTTSQNIPQVSFNPSPLPYDKLAKFESQPADEGRYVNSPSTRVSYGNVRGRKIRNTSPAPFAGLYNRPYTPSSDSHHYGGTPCVSPRPLSSTNQYSGYNATNRSPPTVTSNQILNAPSYNSSARGWGCNVGATTGYQYPQSHMSASKSQIVNAACMPYTDF